ncbi:MAG TPA: hypothetical protein VK110_05655 [Salinisphaeraceae bacterium]|nr:hypothetical protein [Salinisphaeraceae bacterium]
MRAVLIMIVLASLLAACSSLPVYRPAATANDYGYRDTELTATRFRVRFAGGYGVARETVENLALYRAAEVALLHGAQRFQVIGHDTDSLTSYSGPVTSIGYGYGYPYWWGTSIGISHTIPHTRYQTVLEIEIGAGVPATGDRVYDAREIKKHLAPIAESS